jgi:hypothetical protein
MTPVVTESDPTYIALLRAVTEETVEQVKQLHKNLAHEIVGTYAEALDKGRQ